MPQQAGPLKLQDTSSLGLTVDTWGYTDLVNGSWTDIDGVTGDIDNLLPDLVNAGNDNEDPIPDFDSDGLNAYLDGAPWSDYDTTQTGIESSYDVASENFLVAVALSPGDTWSPPAAPYIPPGAFGSGTPSSGSNPTQPGPGEAGGTYLQLVPAGYSFSFFNSTAYGASTFTVGDTFEVDITGPAGAEVTVTSWFAGQQLPDADMGALDGNGNFKLTGNMPPANVGSWYQRWYVGGVLVQQLAFVVAPIGG